jgi:hypothetical protein
MVPIPTDVDGLAVSRDLRTGNWVLRGWGREHRLREWTWAERRRLVSACTRADGLDGLAFVRGMLALLVEPAPPAELAPLYGYVCLGLLGVGPESSRLTLTESEVALARAFGWGPRELAEQPATEVDRLLAHIANSGANSDAHGNDRRQMDEYTPPGGRQGTRRGVGLAGAPAPGAPVPTAPGRHSIVIVDAKGDKDG